MKNKKSILLLAAFLLSFIIGYAQDGMLSTSEKEDILFMIEEEKMARDVYLVFQEHWDQTIFKHIADAEQRHIDLLIELAEEEGIWYPSALIENDRGVFENQEIKNLYENFVARGQVSYEMALKQGAKLEEIDIADLRERMEDTENATILDTYTRLEKASNHHLQAFVRQLKRQGVDYQPVVLNQTVFDEVMKTKKGVSTKKASCSPQNKGNKGKACCASKGKGKGKKSGCEGKK